ncbi:hypothetical protein [Pseudarthrobacter sp. PvP090]|uniref:hypothetical protein n=1 Tax=Pseudarthrobacter sp. PvP090 TaxID=3156393 RepID=UPI0033986AD2
MEKVAVAATEATVTTLKDYMLASTNSRELDDVCVADVQKRCALPMAQGFRLQGGARLMEGNWSWIGVAQVVTAIFSTLAALVALWVGIRSNRRSREALKVQTYLHLRSRFLDIYRELGRLDDSKADAVELQLAREAYWHHVWDEWYIANRLAPREFSGLWDGFFAAAVKSGYEQPALRAAFDELASKPNAGFGAYAQPMIRELRRQEDGSAQESPG